VEPQTDLSQIEQRLKPDFEHGRLYWRGISKYHGEKLGLEAGGKRRDSNTPTKFYWVISVNGVRYKRGKILFYLRFGIWPPMIDHINGDSLDDRPENLRPATYLENNRNRKVAKLGRDLPMGVRKTKSSGRFVARINLPHKQLTLGTFDTSEEASAAYLSARKEHYGAFA
jgi:hypothetical protein